MAISKLKGQEVFLICVVDGKANDKIGPFLDLDVTLRKEVLEGEYLGESTTYFDSVFRGCQLAAKNAPNVHAAIDKVISADLALHAECMSLPDPTDGDGDDVHDAEKTASAWAYQLGVGFTFSENY